MIDHPSPVVAKIVTGGSLWLLQRRISSGRLLRSSQRRLTLSRARNILPSISPHHQGRFVETKIMKNFLPVVCILLASIASACGSNTQPPFGDRYKFADNEMKGWTQDPASDAFWVGTDLVGGTSIDGAAEAYTDQGFVQGMFQTLDGPNSQTCTIRAMDFGTATHATAMYASALANFISQATSIPPYDSSVATGNAAQSGLAVYAHFGAMYFEIYLSGLGDQTSTCTECPLAQQFLDALKTKSN